LTFTRNCRKRFKRTSRKPKICCRKWGCYNLNFRPPKHFSCVMRSKCCIL